MEKLPRGIRNNNPGNIEHGDKWLGLAEEQTDERFATFSKPTYGLRVIVRILLTYQSKHGLSTIEQMINRWAPAHENPTNAYVRFVSEAVGVAPDDSVDVSEYKVIRPMLEALVYYENGLQPYTDAQFDKAITLAGLEVEPRGSRTMKAGTAASGSLIALPVVEEISQHIEPLTIYFEWGKYLILGIALVSVGVMLYARWDDKRKGLR